MWVDYLRVLLDAISPPEPKQEEPARPAGAPGHPESYLILLGEAARAADGQRAAVDELRTRAGLILSAIALIAAFLGPEKLLSASRNPWGIAAMGAASVAAILLLWILWPVTWRFDTDFHKARLEHIEGEDPKTPGELARTLAWWLTEQSTNNENKLRRRYVAFEVAAVLAVTEAATWIIAINWGGT